MRSNAIKRTCTLLTLALSASLFLMPTTAVAAQTLELIAAESFEYSGNIVGKNGEQDSRARGMDITHMTTALNHQVFLIADLQLVAEIFMDVLQRQINIVR